MQFQNCFCYISVFLFFSVLPYRTVKQVPDLSLVRDRYSFQPFRNYRFGSGPEPFPALSALSIFLSLCIVYILTQFFLLLPSISVSIYKLVDLSQKQDFGILQFAVIRLYQEAQILLRRWRICSGYVQDDEILRIQNLMNNLSPPDTQSILLLKTLQTCKQLRKST